MKKNLRLLLTGIAVAAGVFALTATSAFAATVKVTKDQCRVRQSASTSAEVAFTVDQGAELEIISKTEPGDGYTWYEVKKGGDTGFIRSDLVSAPSDEAATTDPAPASSEGSAGDASAPSTATTESQAIAGVVNKESVTVRSGASTSTSKVGNAKSGQEISILGEAMDADGFTWYQVSFTADDKGIEGFIRSDFIDVTQYAEPEVIEEPVEEEPVAIAEAPVVNNDYEVVYEANSEGIDEWFLYDHVKGTKQSINNIYAVMQQSQDNADEEKSTLKTLKIVIIIMAVLLLGLIVAVVILLLKLKDTYEDYPDMNDEGYDDYDDEDSYGYSDEEDDEEEEYEKPKRRMGFGSKKPHRIKKSYDFDDEDEEEDDDDDYVKPTRRSLRQEEESNNTWSTSGMLDIDDDMEFEFLDIDN